MLVTRYPYCIQCTDSTSGKLGDFAYDPDRYRAEGKFYAITPVFDGLDEFYKWCKANGVYYHHGRSHEATIGEVD